MDLPYEIIMNVIQHLDKSDRKSLRFVNETWSSCASESLFDTLYVSPSKEDLDVFEAVTRHPTFSKHVRQLQYDATEFLVDYTKSQYRVQLIKQLSSFQRTPPPQSVVGSDLEQSTNDVMIPTFRNRKEMAHRGSRQLVDNGYREYCEHAIDRQNSLCSGRFAKILCNGLQNLDSLSSVTMDGGWEKIQWKEGWTGSPLRRAWNRFHCAPRSWDPEDEDVPGTLDGSKHYWILVSALVRARRHIRNFSTGDQHEFTPGLAPGVFDRTNVTAPGSPGLDLTAFSALEHLQLRLDYYGDRQNNVVAHETLSGLPILLESIVHLKHLELSLPVDFRNPFSFHDLEEVLPPKILWTRLGSLVLSKVTVTAEYLLLLILQKMPNLKRLSIGNIKLITGAWESVFECLKQSRHLSSLEIQHDTYLYTDVGHYWLDGEYPEHRLYKNFEKYVIHGGCHPFLSDEEPDPAAQKYVRDLEPIVEDYLYQLRHSPSRISGQTARAFHFHGIWLRS